MNFSPPQIFLRGFAAFAMASLGLWCISYISHPSTKRFIKSEFSEKLSVL